MPQKPHPSDEKPPSRAKAGDWVVVHGHAVGESKRTGLILEVLDESGQEHYRVRRDEEHETIIDRGSDATIRREAS